MKGTLFVVATPIGNLKDITLRALQVLKEVDFVLSEKPKTTLKLLNYYRIKKPLIKYFERGSEKQFEKILKLLKEGKNLALVSEAGTPLLSDPGARLIKKIKEEFKDKAKIVPVPGPSAITCFLSIFPLPKSQFLFFGFLPKKKKRKAVLKEIANSKYPVLFFESPHRILKTLKDLEKENQNLKVVVAKELTKVFERTIEGKIFEVIFELEKEKPKGEYSVLVFKENEAF